MAGICFVFGCSHPRQPVDSRSIVIYPGRGVPDLCEVGMSLSALRKKNATTTHGSYKINGMRFILVPSLGAVVPIEKRDKSVRSITFNTAPFDNPEPVRMKLDTPFRGTLEPGVSFAEMDVDVDEVTKALGEPAHTFVLPSSPQPEDYPTPQYIEEVQAAGSWFYRHPSIDTLMYFHRGITFSFKSNSVMRFTVSEPTEGRTTAFTVPSEGAPSSVQ